MVKGADDFGWTPRPSGVNIGVCVLLCPTSRGWRNGEVAVIWPYSLTTTAASLPPSHPPSLCQARESSGNGKKGGIGALWARSWRSAEMWCSVRLTHMRRLICNGFRFVSRDLPEWVGHVCSHDPRLAELEWIMESRPYGACCLSLSPSLSLIKEINTFFKRRKSKPNR